jgi:hypothetical protein
MAERYALLIGNSRYDDAGLAGLKAPDADVRAFARVLRDSEIGGFHDVQTVTDGTCGALQRQIARFYADRRRDDLLLLYFSGHGIKDDAGQLYLAARDTERALLAGTAISSRFVSSLMDASASRSLIVMLDCCNAGAFSAGMKAAATMDAASAFEGNGIGRVVLTATDAVQFAWEGDRIIGSETANSLFTHFVIEGLQTGVADRDDDGYISVDELYEYVYDEVRQRTHKQTPTRTLYKTAGSLLLARRAPRPAPVVAPPDPPVAVPARQAPVNARRVVPAVPSVVVAFAIATMTMVAGTVRWGFIDSYPALPSHIPVAIFETRLVTADVPPPPNPAARPTDAPLPADAPRPAVKRPPESTEAKVLPSPPSATPSPAPLPPPTPAPMATPMPAAVTTPKVTADHAAGPVDAPAVPVVRGDDEQVREVIRLYQRAYRDLDANAVHRLWPAIPSSTLVQLSQSFERARAYDFALGDCPLSFVAGTAKAVCNGTLTFAPKRGTESRASVVAIFHAKRDKAGWIIDGVEIRPR